MTVKWVRVLSKDGRKLENATVDTLAEASPGIIAARGEQVIWLLYINLYGSPIKPMFELDCPGFRITYIDEKALPREVGTILIRGTTPAWAKEGDEIPFKLSQKILLVGRDPDDKI